ncbi:hypothetical protein FGRMN_7776 [Fusarium graminum]|nr:hypothetical protein FGRMN_7776 [Fusarium graminum]
MSCREPVRTTAAAVPLPQFSQAVKYNGIVYCSGSIGIDPVTDALVPGTATDRARMALQNLKAVLEAAGSSMDRVVASFWSIWKTLELVPPHFNVSSELEMFES